MKSLGEHISDEAVDKATGRNWAEWMKVLDKVGAKKLEHKDIVKKLREYKGVSHWWAQTVTVEYERRRGKRKVGQTADAGYQIGVTKTLPVSNKQAWNLLMGAVGKKLWAGKGVKIKIRTQKQGEYVRMTWELSALKAPTVLQLRVTSGESGKGTAISFHQEKLSSGVEREKMKKHWKGVLEKLAELVD